MGAGQHGARWRPCLGRTQSQSLFALKRYVSGDDANCGSAQHRVSGEIGWRLSCDATKAIHSGFIYLLNVASGRYPHWVSPHHERRTRDRRERAADRIDRVDPKVIR